VNNLARDICLQVAATNESTIDSLLASKSLKDNTLTVKEMIHNVEQQIKEPIILEEINRMIV
jgi:translation elongation factor EF-Ts